MTPPVLALYLAATSVARPLAARALARRVRLGKEDPARLAERMGRPSLARPEGGLAWFHAASVGEALSLLPLVERVLEARPDAHALVTTGTTTSAELLAARLPPRAIHQFVPVDVSPAVTGFLDHWRPDVAVWIESEIWPRLVWSTHRRGVPSLLVNARLSRRSIDRWRRIPGVATALFGGFAEMLAQDQATSDALCELSGKPDHVRPTGTIKQAATPLPVDDAELDRIRMATHGRFVWLAASTHPGEENAAIAAHARLLRDDPGALLIIVPRHPGRGDDVADLLDKGSLPWARRREGPPDDRCAIYLADTLGELGLWYRVASVAFVGGSLADVGGHNPYEPIALSSAIIHGPNISNFADVYDKLEVAGATRRVSHADELHVALEDLSDAGLRAQLVERARQVAGRDDRALESAVSAVLRHFGDASSTVPPASVDVLERPRNRDSSFGTE